MLNLVWIIPQPPRGPASTWCSLPDAILNSITPPPTILPPEDHLWRPCSVGASIGRIFPIFRCVARRYESIYAPLLYSKKPHKLLSKFFTIFDSGCVYLTLAMDNLCCFLSGWSGTSDRFRRCRWRKQDWRRQDAAEYSTSRVNSLKHPKLTKDIKFFCCTCLNKFKSVLSLPFFSLSQRFYWWQSSGGRSEVGRDIWC